MGNESIRENAWNLYRGMKFLVDVTGVGGLPARSVMQNDVEDYYNDSYNSSREWYNSTTDPGWMWLGDTSSDEVCCMYTPSLSLSPSPSHLSCLVLTHSLTHSLTQSINHLSLTHTHFSLPFLPLPFFLLITTSFSPQIVGHIFAYTIAYNLVASSETEKKSVADTLDSIMSESAS